MNDSPSSASLASSLKKPSTAASSTTSKRTRTIIVARSITDAPSSTSGAAERTSALNMAGSSAGAGSWRSNDGKLPAYAALGGAEDVALYEKFLAERKGHSSVAELRAMGGASSPQHLKASMKRKTMSQLIGSDSAGATAPDVVGSRSMSALPRPDDGDAAGSSTNASTSGGASTDTSAATRALVQLEMASDAKKRREALVEHRKWLKTLPIHARLAHARQHNALKHWQQINKDWERFKARAAKNLNKPAHALVMSRAAAYREQVEMYDALQKARPLAEKVGGDIWLVSLRDDGTRFVPVGNIFSGLFCPIRESTRIGPRVRRPLDPSYAATIDRGDTGGGEDSDDNNSSSHRHALARPVSHLEKRSLEMLAKKKRRLRKQLQALLPHEVESSAAGHLVVETADLFEWASRGHGSSAATDAVDASESSDAIIRALHDTSRSASRDDETARVNSVRTVDISSSAGPSVRLAIESENTDSGADMSGAGHLEQHQLVIATDASSKPSPVRLSFYGDTHQQLQRSITLENDGSTVLHYEWTREAFVDPELTPHLQHARSRKEIQEQDDACTTTSLSQTLGSLLPGETQAFVFSFEAQRPGLYLEKWLLDVDPPARVQVGGRPSINPSSHELEPCDARPFSPATASARRIERPRHGAIQVHLSCTAVDNFFPRRQHMTQQRAVERKATVFMVEQLVDEVLARVDSQPRVIFPDLHTLASRFYDVNSSDRAFGDVYYSDALVAQCRVFDALAATQREDEWDLRLASLAAITHRADALNAAKAKMLMAELTAIATAEEEEEEEEDDDEDVDEEEDEDSSEEDEDSDDNASDSEQQQERPPMPPKEVKETRAVRRERIARERSARRQELNDAISALRTRLQDAFRVACLEAYAAPYASTQLHARLAQGIASLCSEVPVIHAIARMQLAQSTSGSQSGGDDDARVATERGVAHVLARAIDEAVAFDADYQSSYELARRESQQVLLRDALTFRALLSQSQAKSLATSDAATDLSDSAVVAVPQQPTWFASGVLLLHVDLDLACWFTLVKEQSVGADAAVPDAVSAALSQATTPTDATGAVEAAPVSLTWQFSPELLAHDTFVPAKVALAAQTLASLVELVTTFEIPVKAIVLTSELSAPPVTKAAQKLLQQVLVSASASSGSNSDEARSLAAQRASLLQRLAAQLSLQPVAAVLKCAMGGSADGAESTSITFCASLEELAAKVHALETSDTAATARSVIEGESEDASASTLMEVPLSTGPTIFLLEHLDALARVAGGRGGGDSVRPSSALSPSTAAPAVPPPESKPVPTPAAPGGKKSVATVPAPKAGAAPAADTKAPTPTTASTTAPVALAQMPATTAVASAEATAHSCGMAITRQDVDALASKLAHVCDAFVVETFLPSPWERMFGGDERLVTEPSPPSSSLSQDVDTQAPGSTREPSASRKPVMLGPMLLAKVEYWAQFVQSPPPSLLPPASPAPLFGAKPRDTAVTAVLGGKDLASKLRLIDSLLDVAHVIYFVGDVALSLCRVLFTKHDDTRRRWRGQSARSPSSLWSVLVPVVERLKQKAHRKCVQLLLPVDWVVGDTTLEEQDTASSAYDEDDDDDEDDNEDDANEEEDDDEADEMSYGDERAHRRSSKATKRKHKKLCKALKKPKKPIIEPEELAPWRTACQWQYEGETAVVSCMQESSSSVNDQDAVAPWVSVFDVNADFFSKFAVVQGKASVLESRAVTDDEDDDDEDNGKEEAMRADEVAPSSLDSSGDAAAPGAAPSSGDASPTDSTRDAAPPAFVLDTPTAFEYEWTFRAFDVGPASLRILLQQLQHAGHDEQQHQQLIVHGVCGVVECQSFDRATRELVKFLEASGFQQHQLLSVATAEPQLERRKALLLSGETTLQWLQRFETPGKSYHTKLVTHQSRKMASVLRDVLAAKPNAMLLQFRDHSAGTGAASGADVSGAAPSQSSESESV